MAAAAGKKCTTSLPLFMEAYDLEVEEELSTTATQYWPEGVWTRKSRLSAARLHAQLSLLSDRTHLSAARLHAQLSLLSDRTRLRRLKHTLHS